MKQKKNVVLKIGRVQEKYAMQTKRSTSFRKYAIETGTGASEKWQCDWGKYEHCEV